MRRRIRRHLPLFRGRFSNAAREAAPAGSRARYLQYGSSAGSSVARRCRNPAVRNPLSANARAIEAAKTALDSHREAFRDAKQAREEGIERSRNALRKYKEPLSTAVTN